MKPLLLSLLLLAGAPLAARADDVTDVRLRGRGARVSVNVGPGLGTGFGGGYAADPFAAYSGFGGAYGGGFAAPGFAPRAFQAFPFRNRFGRLCVYVPGLGVFCR